MAFNQTQFFENLEKLTTKVIDKNKKGDFIYDFLSLLDVSKSTITSLKKSDARYNVAANPELGEVANKHRIYFKPVGTNQDLSKVLSELKDSHIIGQYKIRMIMVTDFDTVLVNDTRFDKILDCDFSDLYKNYHFLLPLAGLERAREYSEHPAEVQASEKMGRLFDHIRKYNEFDNADDIHALNIFLTRLLFCLYAEDTGIFAPNQFHDVIDGATKIDGSDVHSVLFDLFDVLDLPMSSAERDNQPTHLAAFPYVNSSLFKYQFIIPEFNARTRHILLECARLNWAEINPDIFGSMFQVVIDPEQRGSLGQHYTSVSNIMKVIQPLFLDDLREEVETIIALSNDNRHRNNKSERLDALLNRISQIKIFDLAAGSANFMIIAYKELRKLEIDILKAQRDLMKGAKDNLLGLSFDSVVSLNNFYGIEYDDFACQIAPLSLWLAEHQMNVLFEQELGASRPMLPLRDSGHIVHGNSLRIDWAADRVMNIINKDRDELLAQLCQSPGNIKNYLAAETNGIEAEAVSDTVLTSLIRSKYPTLDENEIRQTQEGLMQYMAINREGGVIEGESKTVDKKVLHTISDAVHASRSTVTEAEALLMWPKVINFIKTKGREPNLNSSDNIEKRMAEIMAYIRSQKAKENVVSND